MSFADLDDEDADLLGLPPRGRPAPPPQTHREQRLSVLNDLVRHRRNMETSDDSTSFDLADMHAGVTVGWLGRVFGMDPSTVKKRLADCPPLHRRKSGYVYALPQAAGYLIKPVFDVHAYLKTMKPGELPSQLQKEFWDAALKRQKWELNAGELWHTQDVLDVLGEAFASIKFTMQLWADNLERATGLTDEQRRLLVGMVDGLQNDIHEALVEQAKNRRTASSSKDLDGLVDDV